LVLALLFLIGSAAPPLRARAEPGSVSLSFFEANGQFNQVDLIWETATELNNSGFYVNRSDSPTGTKARIDVYIPDYDSPLDFVPSTSDGLTNTYYEAYDRDVVGGMTYYYWIESVSTNSVSTFSNVQSAAPIADITTTLTATVTPTPTPTGTLTPNGTSTATRTVTPTGTTPSATATRTRAPTVPPSSTPNFSFPPTSTSLPSITLAPELTISETLVPSDTITPTSTPTLVPLPSITLLFPLTTDTGTPTPTNAPGAKLSVSDPSIPSSNSGLSPGVILLIAVILIIWILLGAFLFFYIRRIGTQS
jgi:hypothetical protein